jgi:Spy/CpxP family protein refolding chaperone
MSVERGTEPTKRLRLEAIGLLVMALVVGVLVGVTGERLRANRQVPERSGFRRDSGFLPSPWERIGLTEAQQEQIQGILQVRRDRTDSIMQDLLPRIHGHLDNVRSEIAEILTEEQLEQLDREFESRRRHRGDSGGRRDYWRGGRRRPPEGGRRPQRPD